MNRISKPPKLNSFDRLLRRIGGITPADQPTTSDSEGEQLRSREAYAALTLALTTPSSDTQADQEAETQQPRLDVDRVLGF